MRASFLASAWVIGCTGGTTSDDAGETDVDTDQVVVGTADTGAPDPALSVACAMSADNPLRASCEVAVVPPAVVEITLTRDDGGAPERTFNSPEGTDAASVVLYWMAPETDYTWTASVPTAPDLGEVTGALRPGALPAELGITTTVTGTASASLYGLASPCSEVSAAVIVDGAGVPQWIQPIESQGYVDAVTFTEDGTVLALVGSDITEYALDGTVLLHLERGTDFAERIHHDVFRRDGLTYGLFQEAVQSGPGDYLMDGFYVFDAAGAIVGEWHLIDHHVPVIGTQIPLGIDYSHANSIWVDEAGDVLVSFRHLSAFAKIAGLQAADSGAIRWTVSGDPTHSPLGGGFTLTASAGGIETFELQHNVHPLPSGAYALFDNRKSFLEPSRVLQLQVDPVALTADISAVYTLPEHCPFQGGAWHTDAGNPIGTCAPLRTAYEFDGAAAPGSAATFTLQAQCGSELGIFVPRVTPLEW